MKSKDSTAGMIWLEKATALLDDSFRIPGTRIRFGLDAVLGLVPGLGDIVGFGISGFLVLVMVRYGASGMLVVKMLWNLMIDALFGSIPLLGTIFDVANRANRRNLRLLKEHYQEDKHQGGAWWVVAVIFFVLIGLIILLVYLVSRLLSWLFSLF